MAKKAKPPFDPEIFLANAHGGRSISKFKKGDVVFAQAQPADSVFYIQQGKVKIAVTSKLQSLLNRERKLSSLPWNGRLFWRRMPDWAAIAPGGGRGHDGLRDHAGGQTVYDPRAPRRAVVFREIHGAPACSQ